jgi:hypothetical protein
MSWPSPEMRRLKSLPASLLLAASLASSPACAAGEADPLLWPSLTAGFSYPLVFSMSIGAVLPLWKHDKDYFVPSAPGLRVDVEAGLGGGSVSAGMYVPVKDLFAINLKAVRMRTWLWTWHEPRDRTFEGGVIEFVMPSPHGGPKLGIGSFRDVGTLNGRRDTFTYIFVGVGM